MTRQHTSAQSAVSHFALLRHHRHHGGHPVPVEGVARQDFQRVRARFQRPGEASEAVLVFAYAGERLPLAAVQPVAKHFEVRRDSVDGHRKVTGRCPHRQRHRRLVQRPIQVAFAVREF